MKPQYEQYRTKGNKQHTNLKGFRLPVALYGQLESLAAIEGDSVTGLVIEGIARVIEDRANPANLAASAETIREDAEAQIAALHDWAEHVRGQTE